MNSFRMTLYDISVSGFVKYTLEKRKVDTMEKRNGGYVA